MSLEYGPDQTVLNARIPLYRSFRTETSGMMNPETGRLFPINSHLVRIMKESTIDTFRSAAGLYEIVISFKKRTSEVEPTLLLHHYLGEGRKPIARSFIFLPSQDKLQSESVKLISMPSMDLPYSISSGDLLQLVREILGIIPKT